MTYVMGDIHGYYGRFEQMLKKINFSDEDELYITGDVIDRGSMGIKVLNYVMKHDNIHMVMGNHEHMMMCYLEDIPFYGMKGTKEETRDIWFSNGGEVTLDEYMKCSEEKQNEIRKFIRNMNYEYHITVGNKKVRILHAYPADISKYDMRNQLQIIQYHSSVIWDRPDAFEKFHVEDDEIVFIGHTPVFYYGVHGKIYKFSQNVYDIDCGMAGMYPKRCLACVRIDDMKEFYV